MTTPSDTLGETRELGRGLFELEFSGKAQEARRFLAGLALSASYGLALGARSGALSMAEHAVGVPLAFVAVALIGGPAFFVALAHAGVEVSAFALGGSLAAGTATAGLVLAGVAPTMLLLSVTCESGLSVALYAVLGLSAAAYLGAKSMFAELSRQPGSSELGARLPRLAFGLFSGILCSRVWWSGLPTLGGGQ